MHLPIKASYFAKTAATHGIGKWLIHSCSFCDYGCGFIFTGPKVQYDSGCYCSRQMLRDSSWQDVADHYSIQTDPIVIEKYQKFWKVS